MPSSGPCALPPPRLPWYDRSMMPASQPQCAACHTRAPYRTRPEPTGLTARCPAQGEAVHQPGKVHVLVSGTVKLHGQLSERTLGLQLMPRCPDALIPRCPDVMMPCSPCATFAPHSCVHYGRPHAPSIGSLHQAHYRTAPLTLTQPSPDPRPGRAAEQLWRELLRCGASCGVRGRLGHGLVPRPGAWP